MFTPKGFDDPTTEFKKKNAGSIGKLIMTSEENSTTTAKTFSAT